MSEGTWQGDWIARIYRRVHKRGFESVTAFAVTRPTATLLELAAELGEGVAAIQIEGVLYSEAEKSGTFAGFARGLLVRCIWQWMPAGWNTGEEVDMQRADVFAEWSACVKGFMKKSIRKTVWERLKAADVPTGWLPEGPSDPFIEQAFVGLRFDTPAGE